MDRLYTCCSCNKAGPASTMWTIRLCFTCHNKLWEDRKKLIKAFKETMKVRERNLAAYSFSEAEEEKC